MDTVAVTHLGLRDVPVRGVLTIVGRGGRGVRLCAAFAVRVCAVLRSVSASVASYRVADTPFVTLFCANLVGLCGARVAWQADQPALTMPM